MFRSMSSSRNRTAPLRGRPGLLPDAHCGCRSRTLARVDREGLIKEVATIDPLAVGPARVFGDNQRMGQTIGDLAGRESLVVDHDPFGRFILALDPLAVDAAVVTRSSPCHALPHREVRRDR